MKADEYWLLTRSDDDKYSFCHVRRGVTKHSLDNVIAVIVLSNIGSPTHLRARDFFNKKSIAVYDLGQITGTLNPALNLPIGTKVVIEPQKDVISSIGKILSQLKSVARSQSELPRRFLTNLSQSVQIQTVIVKDNGFVFEHLFVTGSYIVKFAIPGIESKVYPVRLTRDSPHQHIRHSPSRTVLLSGSLWGNNGPITEAKITLKKVDNFKDLNSVKAVYKTAPDQKGEFYFDRFGAGQYVLTATGNTKQGPFVAFKKLELEDQDHDLGRIEPLKNFICGRVFDVDGKIRKGVVVTSFPAGQPHNFWIDSLKTRTNEAGEYYFFVSPGIKMAVFASNPRSKVEYYFSPRTQFLYSNSTAEPFLLKKKAGKYVKLVFEKDRKLRHGQLIFYAPAQGAAVEIDAKKVNKQLTYEYNCFFPESIPGPIWVFELDHRYQILSCYNLASPQDAQATIEVNSIDPSITRVFSIKVTGMDYAFNPASIDAQPLIALTVYGKKKEFLFSSLIFDKNSQVAVPIGAALVVSERSGHAGYLINGKRKIVIEDAMNSVDLVLTENDKK